MDIIKCLEERGLIDAITNPEIKRLTQGPLRVYLGFDPTSDSLHLGHLVGIMVLHWFQKFGHQPYALLGGATAKIGDPSGKSVERPLLDSTHIETNIKKLYDFFQKCLVQNSNSSCLKIVNNNDWVSCFHLIDFLRDVGRHFRVNVMLTKDSVRNRLAAEEGLSFTEFSYQLLQAYDFYYLYQNEGIVLQIGGSDQWGNITAGIELIRKLLGETAYGLTFPLLIKSDGKKFGKTEQGAIWLSEDRCSSYDFYQYLYRVSDADVIKLLRMLTCLDLQEIYLLEKEMHQPDYIPNTVQKRLAEEVTRFIHGDKGVTLALQATQAASPGHLADLNPMELQQIIKDLPHFKILKSDILDRKFADIALQVGLVKSKGEATRLILQGGAYLNNQRIEDPSYQIQEKEFIGGEFLVLSAGKKKKIFIQALTKLV